MKKAIFSHGHLLIWQPQIIIVLRHGVESNINRSGEFLPAGFADALIRIMDAAIPTLGNCRIRSPLRLKSLGNALVGNFVPDATRIRFSVEVNSAPELLFEKAGPREMIFFDPARTRAATSSSDADSHSSSTSSV